MTVHVWTKDGEYIGEIFHERFDRLEMKGEHADKQAVMDALLSRPPMNDMGGIDLKTDKRRFLEFPSEEWLHVAAVLYLPPAGFRVHVTAGPSTGEDL